MSTDPALEEMQIAIVAFGERMANLVSWADELQRQFRLLGARIAALERPDNIEERLAAVREKHPRVFMCALEADAHETEQDSEHGNEMVGSV